MRLAHVSTINSCVFKKIRKKDFWEKTENVSKNVIKTAVSSRFLEFRGVFALEKVFQCIFRVLVIKLFFLASKLIDELVLGPVTIANHVVQDSQIVCVNGLWVGRNNFFKKKFFFPTIGSNRNETEGANAFSIFSQKKLREKAERKSISGRKRF